MTKLLLYPLSVLYGIVVYFRNRMYDLNMIKSKEFDVPVISIGNITVGGTGKTPHVEYLVNLLSQSFNVATLSRGYKRKTRGFRYVKVDSTVSDVGDEPLQIKRKFPEVTVSVCEKRVEGTQKLLNSKNNASPDVVILDDAFQHRRISPGINILLIDFNRQIKEDHLLPYGRMREGAAQMRRANIIVFTKCPDEITPITRRILMKDVDLKPYQKLFFTSLEYEPLRSVFSGQDLDKEFYEKRSCSVLLVTGIASPLLIRRYIEKFTSNIELLSYPDHHNFSKGDMEIISKSFEKLEGKNKIVVTTEKDAMRLKDRKDLSQEFMDVLYYLPVKVKFVEEDGKSFNKKILNYVGENKSNRELHKRKNQRSS